MWPVSPELFLLTIRVLSDLSTHFMPNAIVDEIFHNEKFKNFLLHVATYPNGLIRFAVLQMCDKLSKKTRVNDGKGEGNSMEQVHSKLRPTVIKLLGAYKKETSEYKRRSMIDFLLELLLLITPNEPKTICSALAATGGDDTCDFSGNNVF
jgi:hypothetical protein